MEPLCEEENHHQIDNMFAQLYITWSFYLAYKNTPVPTAFKLPHHSSFFLSSKKALLFIFSLTNDTNNRQKDYHSTVHVQLGGGGETFLNFLPMWREKAALFQISPNDFSDVLKWDSMKN